MDCVCSPTWTWGQQPAVQVTSCHRVVEHQSALTIHRVQDVLHGDGCVRVWILLPRLPLHKQISKRPRSTTLCHRQGLVMVTWDESPSQVNSAAMWIQDQHPAANFSLLFWSLLCPCALLCSLPDPTDPGHLFRCYSSIIVLCDIL